MKRTVLIVAVAALCLAGSAVAQDRSGQYLGSGGRAADGGQILGSGGFTTQDSGQVMGSGGRSDDGSATFDSGGFLGSGNRTTDGGGTIGSGTQTADSGQVIGSGISGLAAVQLRLLDGSSLLVVISDEGMFVIPIEDWAH